jgi:sugar lactone lactonase YvrE
MTQQDEAAGRGGPRPRHEVRALAAEVAIAARMEIGESPRWDDHNGELLWVDTMRGLIHRGRPDRSTTAIIDAGQPVGCVALTSSGGLIAAIRDGFASIPATGRTVLLASVEADLPDTRMNDGACDPAGRFWAGTMELEAAPGRGSLYRLDPDLTVRSMLSDVSCSNGVGWSPDGGQMYFVDSPRRSVDIFDFVVSTGAISGRAALVEIDPEDGVPDGLTVDEAGYVWVALWDGGEVRRYAPTGELDLVVKVPVRRPTSCVFGGEHLDELYITTASIGSDAQDIARGAGSVFLCRPGIRGMPGARFAGG